MWDTGLLGLAFFLCLWQVPHFWLLAVRCGAEYEHAGLPSLTRFFREEQLGRLAFVWTCSVAASCLLLPLFGSVQSHLSYGLVVLTALSLARRSAVLLRREDLPDRLSFAFRDINRFAGFVIALVALDPFVV